MEGEEGEEAREAEVVAAGEGDAAVAVEGVAVKEGETVLGTDSERSEEEISSGRLGTTKRWLELDLRGRKRYVCWSHVILPVSN